MEKRFGSLLIMILNSEQAKFVNNILSKHSDIVLSRCGLPVRDKKINLISIIVEALPEEINALAGQLGRLPFVEVKSCMHKQITPNNQNELA
jgi:putative iron-only hydrogenase system regulator